MIKKTRVIIAAGGTGGHVLPGVNLTKFLQEKNYKVEIVTDKRGFKYLDDFKDNKIFIMPSSPFKSIFSIIFIFYSILRSVVFLTFNRPKVIFGMGGYASFPICFAATILKIKFIIYENNFIIGKTNKYLLPFAQKMLVSSKELEGIPKRYSEKIEEVGNIIKKNIINFSKKDINIFDNTINILILGGSQAAKIFAETLPNIFKKLSINGVKLKIYQHCLPYQNDYLSSFYQKTNIDFELFNFSKDLTKYFSKVNLAITRSGSSILAELTNASIPFISVPLPSSADNHQFKNAIYYQKKDFSFLVEEKELKDKLFYLIKDLSENNFKLYNIVHNQRQFSDKNVYNNIDKILKEIIDEKN